MAFASWIGGKNVVVVDGQPGEPFDSVTPIALSNDGATIAYGARWGDAQIVVVGNRKSRPYSAVGDPVLSGDGRAVAYAASDGADWFVVRNDREGPRFDWVGQPVLDASGRQLAYAAEQRDPDGSHRSFIVVNDRRGPESDRVTTPAFSGDGRVVGYGAASGGLWTVVAGDRRIPAPGVVTEVFLSDDGSRIGYVIREEGGVRVADSWNVGEPFDWVGWPKFAPDGRPVYLASRGECRYLVSGRRSVQLGEWVVWDLDVDPDGSRAGFGARIDRGLWWKVIPVPRGSETDFEEVRK